MPLFCLSLTSRTSPRKTLLALTEMDLRLLTVMADLCVATGCVLLVAGCLLIAPWLALIVGGALLVLTGFALGTTRR